VNIITQRSLSNQVQNSVNNVLQKRTFEHSFGARPFIHFDDLTPTSITLHNFGVKFNFHAPSENSHGNNGNAYSGVSGGMSANSRKRLIQKTSALEFAGEYATHMLTVTLPPQRWEKITTNTEKTNRWRHAKRVFLKAIRKRLKDKGTLSFQEFQTKNGRKAPHLHILIGFEEWLNDDEFNDWLKFFEKEWQKALEWCDELDGDFPAQSVDFNFMRENNFAYARKYASKLEQKDAPFDGAWGQWWSVGGKWRQVKALQKIDVEMSDNVKRELLEYRCEDEKPRNWIIWSLMKYEKPILYEKILTAIKKNKTAKTKTIQGTYEGAIFELKYKVASANGLTHTKKEKEHKKMAQMRYQMYLKYGNRRWRAWIEKYPLDIDYLISSKVIRYEERERINRSCEELKRLENKTFSFSGSASFASQKRGGARASGSEGALATLPLTTEAGEYRPCGTEKEKTVMQKKSKVFTSAHGGDKTFPVTQKVAELEDNGTEK